MNGFSERRGAHRPAGLGPTSAIPWLVAAVAIVLIVAFASGWFGASEQPASTVAAGSTSTKASTPPKTTKPSGTATSSSAGGSPTAPAATVDRAQSVSVLNGTSRSGLAKRAAATLRTAGWTIRSTGNYRGGNGRTTVYYGSSSLQATAQAVAADLGGGAVAQESRDFGPTRVTVVLGSDFQP